MCSVAGRESRRYPAVLKRNRTIRRLWIASNRIFGGSEDPATFWKRFCSGESFGGKFPRIGQNGQTVWIFATYGSLMACDGRISNVVKLAQEITGRKNVTAMISNARDLVLQRQPTAQLNLAQDAGFGDLDQRFIRSQAELSRVFGAMSSTFGTLTTQSEKQAQHAKTASERTRPESTDRTQHGRPSIPLTDTLHQVKEGGRRMTGRPRFARSMAEMMSKIDRLHTKRMYRIRRLWEHCDCFQCVDPDQPDPVQASFASGASQTPTSCSYCVVIQPSACSGFCSSIRPVKRLNTAAERLSSIMATSCDVITVS